MTGSTVLALSATPNRDRAAALLEKMRASLPDRTAVAEILPPLAKPVQATAPAVPNPAQEIAAGVTAAASTAIRDLASYQNGRERDYEAAADINHRAADGSITTARILVKSIRR